MLAACAAFVLSAASAQEQEPPAAPTPPATPGDTAFSAPANSGSPETGALSDPGATRGPGFSVPPAQDVPYPGTLSLRVDLSDVERRIYAVHEIIPVKPGRVVLLYPEWVPGQHAPRGPIEALAGLTMKAGGRVVPWQRDAVNVYAFAVNIPANVTQLELDFQFVSAQTRDQGRLVVTPDLLGLEWNTVLLYPAGYYSDRIPVSAQVTLPAGWEFAGALEVEAHPGREVRFRSTTLQKLVDAPLFAGRYLRSLDLDPGARIPVHLNVVADAPEFLDVKPPQLVAHRRLIHEAYAVFGPAPFDRYEFLLALSDHFGEIGLEHDRSSENARSPGYFLEWERTAASRDLLPHEFVHAWNGKLRAPAGLLTANFNTPTHNSLLWVYEGLTSYMATVLATRSGLWSPELARQAWASMAANLDRNRPGRAWRDLEDTTTQPIITARRPLPWLSWQRTEDYYAEGELLWLDIDTRIRELSGGRRSLDDFLRAFTTTTAPAPVAYTFADIVRALQSVAAFDWEGWLNQQLQGHGPGAPLGGLERAGWKLVYSEVPSEYVRSLEDQRHALDFTYSVGFAVSMVSGQLTEVRWAGPAYEAGLTTGTLLVAVNGREYRPDRLRAAITAARATHQPFELLVKNLDRYRTVRLGYYGGLSYPQLQRIERGADRLGAILKPRTEGSR